MFTLYIFKNEIFHYCTNLRTKGMVLDTEKLLQSPLSHCSEPQLWAQFWTTWIYPSVVTVERECARWGKPNIGEVAHVALWKRLRLGANPNMRAESPETNAPLINAQRSDPVALLKATHITKDNSLSPHPFNPSPDCCVSGNFTIRP